MNREEKQDFQQRVAYLREKARQLRIHIVEMIYTAKSGHPGGALSIADIMAALYFDILRIDPAQPHRPQRDRFILSKGHTCPAWYGCLAMRGFFPMEHLKTLRKFESILQGHPDMLKTPGVDMTTGSLGQGLSCGLGMALEGRFAKKDFDVYVILGDGEINEGMVWEAAAAANKYKLDNVVAIIDNNKLQMDGFTEDIMPMEPIGEKFKAFNWEVMSMDGHDMAEVLSTLQRARDFRGKPVCIVAETVKGKGVSYMENVRKWHGDVPDDEEFQIAMRELKGNA